MNILVTGGAGYIGAHTCKRLKLDGYIPVIFDNLSTGHESFVRWGEFVYGDIHNQDLLEEVLKKFNITAVLHFAASSIVSEANSNPLHYYNNNVTGTSSLLKAMINCNVKHLIFSSTAAIFGLATVQPITENTLQAPINVYGRSKYMIEQILDDVKLAHDFHYTCLRYFNAAGADSTCEIGELHIPETHLIPRILDVAIGKVKSIDIYGNDYNTPDGTCIRDYVHVEDLAIAHVLALKKQLSDKKSMKINLGGSLGSSVKEIITAAQTVTKKQIDFKIGPRRIGDPDVLICDNSLAKA